MPLYEYKCKCGHRFEALRSMDDRHNAPCLKCGKPASKVISVVNHTFGFRLTDACNERFGPRDEYEKDV